VAAMMGWTEISSLATGAGTLVLAVATFASVRSANRAARVAEQALMVNMRPLLVPSRADDTRQKIFFQEGRHMILEGGRGGAEFENGVVYLGVSLRNAGPGIAVLHGWRFMTGVQPNPPRPDLEAFRHQGRDILVAPGDIGFWQGAFRDSDDAQYDEAVAAVKNDDDEVVLNIDPAVRRQRRRPARHQPDAAARLQAGRTGGTPLDRVGRPALECGPARSPLGDRQHPSAHRWPADRAGDFASIMRALVACSRCSATARNLSISA
jgi:hypothetical protein